MAITSVLRSKFDSFFSSEKVSSAQNAIVHSGNRRSVLNSFFNIPSEQRLDFVEQYSSELWVYICINRIAQSLSRVPLKVFRKKSRNGLKGITKAEHNLIRKYGINLGEYNLKLECYLSNNIVSKFPIELIQKLDFVEEAFDSDLQKILDRPNPHFTKYYLLEGSTTYLELRGDSFIELVGMKEGPVGLNNPPVEMWHLNPDNITIIPGKNNDFIHGYIYDAGTRRVPIRKENIIHLRYFNPDSMYYGQGTIEALVTRIKHSKNTSKYQDQFFKQGMKPSAVISTDDNLGDAQFERLLEQIEENYGGLKNMHKPLLLEGGMSWTSMSVTQREAELIRFLEIGREEFLAAFGVPPILVGLPTENRATANAAKATYYEDTIMPKGQLHEDKLNNELAPLYGDEFFVKFDWSQTVIGKKDSEEFGKSLESAFRNAGITQNEYRSNLTKLGIEIGDKINIGEAGDSFYLQSSLLPVNTINGELAGIGDTDINETDTEEDSNEDEEV